MESFGLNKHRKRRTERVELRLTEVEKRQLEDDAASASTEISEFIRSKIFGTTPRKHAQANGARAELINSLGELGKIGSNINQIARSLNREVIPEKWKIEDALKEVENLGHYIRSVLHGH